MSYAYYTESYESKLFDDLKKSISTLLNELPEYCSTYFQNLTDSGKKNRTILCYLLDVKTFLLFIRQINPEYAAYAISDIPVEYIGSLEPEDIEAYLAWLGNYEMDGENFRNSPRGKRRKLTSLRSFYLYLNKARFIRTNPALIVEPPESANRQRSLSDEQRQNLTDYLFEVLDDAIYKAEEEMEKEENKRSKRVLLKPYIIRRDIAIIELLFLGNMKVCEILALDIEDVDMQAMELAIYDSGSASHKVSFTGSVKKALSDYLENARIFLSPNAHNDSALFISAKHTRISARTVERTVKTYTKDLFDEDFYTPYSLS